MKLKVKSTGVGDRVSISLPTAIYKKLKAIAESNKRTMSAQIAWWAEEDKAHE